MKKTTRIIALLILTIFLSACDSSLFTGKKYIIKYYDGDNLVYKYGAEKGSQVKNKIIEKEGYTFLGWDLDGDGIVDELPIVTESLILRAVYKEPSEITYKFISGTELLDTRKGKIGEVLILPNCSKQATSEYSYVFLGWDANDDGIPESSPYTLTGDVTFYAIYEKQKMMYTYTIFDRGRLLKQEYVEYGTEIVYPKLEEFIIDDGKYKVFAGWSYEGYDVDYIDIIKTNLVINSIYTDNQVLVLHYENNTLVNKTEVGESIVSKIPFSKEGYGMHFYLDSNYEVEYPYIVMPSGYVELYCRLEKTSDINDMVLKTDKKVSIVYSKEELLNVLNSIILNRITEKTITINFSFDSINDLMNYLCDNAITLRNYGLSASYQDGKLYLKLSYDNINYKVSENIHYKEIKSLNVSYKKTRDDSFNSFYIDKVSKTYEAVDSDSLFFILEHGYKPIIRDTKLLQLYEKMRNVLRNIINDTMSEIEKALAIYEWIISNTIYDYDILLKTDKDAKEYNSFFLEGVFDDHLAVCDGISKAYAALCNIEGIKCVQVTGSSVSNAIKHAWNKVQIAGKWYIVDPTSGGTIIGSNEILSHYFFMISSDEYKNYYIEEKNMFSNIIVKDGYNIYNDLYIGKEDKKSIKVKSIEEAGSLFGALNTITENSSLEMYLDFPVSDLKNTIQEIISCNKIDIKVNYLFYNRNGKYIIIFIVQK